MVTQDSQESQMFVMVTLTSRNYWGNLCCELALEIRSRSETFAQLLSFQNQKESIFSQGEPNIWVSSEVPVLMQVILILNLNLHWENWEIQKVVKCADTWLWRNRTRHTHLWPGSVVKTFRQVKNCKCKAIIFPEDISNHLCRYVTHLQSYIFLFYKILL